MSPLEPSNPTTAGSENSNVAEAQEKDLKTAFTTKIEILKEDINKFPKEIKDKQLKEINKAA